MSLIIRLIPAFALVLFARTAAVAQLPKPGFVLGVYAMGADPKGTFDQSYSFGAGGEAFGGVGLGNTYGMVTLGYAAFFARSGTGVGMVTYVPVKVGVRQYFLAHRLFVNADIGTAAVRNKGNTGSRFVRGIGAGVKLPGIEFGLYYDGWKNGSGYSNSVFGKIGYSFSL